MTEKEYDVLVGRGKKVAGGIASHQWELGELAAKFTTEGKGGGLNEIGDLRRYADYIGVPYGTLKDYRATFLAFPSPAVRTAGGWANHKALVPVPENAREQVVADALALTREIYPEADTPTTRAIKEAAKPYKPKPSRKNIEATATAQAMIDLHEVAERLNRVLEDLPDVIAEGEPLRDMLASLDTITETAGAIGTGLMSSDSVEQGLEELVRNG